MRFLLLGGAGYLGGRLAKHLKVEGHEVHITTRRPPSEVPSWMCADRIIQLDPSLKPALEPLLEGVDILIHLAAPDQEAAQRCPAETVRFGAETTWNVLDAVASAGASVAVLYLSTYHVYGRNLHGIVTEETPAVPMHPYALSKRFAEETVQLFRQRLGVKALCIRLSNAFGTPLGPEISQWSLVFNDLCRQAATLRALKLRSAGVQKRNFVTMADSVRALEFLAVHQDGWPDDGVIHLGSTICLSIREVAEIVAGRTQEVLGFRPDIQAPGLNPAERPSDLTFSVERLSRLGFQWCNELQREVDLTLRLCAAVSGRNDI